MVMRFLYITSCDTLHDLYFVTAGATHLVVVGRLQTSLATEIIETVVQITAAKETLNTCTSTQD